MTTDTDAAFDVTIASKLAAKIRLSDVVFAGVEASVVNAFAEDATSLSFDIAKADTRWFRVGDELRVAIPYQIDVSQQLLDQTKREIVRVRVLFRVDYQLSADINPSDDEIHNFVGISAFMHSWPYLRAEVESLTMKMRLPPLVLPVMLSGHAHHVMSVRKLVEDDLQPAFAMKAAAGG